MTHTKYVLLSIVAAGAMAACNAESSAHRNDPASSPLAPQSAQSTHDDATFGALVEGTVAISVASRIGLASEGGPHEVTIDEPAQIAELIDAVGRDTARANSVPRCPLTYRFTFVTAGGNRTTLDAVCSAAATVVFVKDGTSYTAADPNAVRRFLDAHHRSAE